MSDPPAAKDLFEKVEAIRKSDPDNRCVKYLDQKHYESLTDAERAVFWQCVRTGIDNHDSSMGCYAMKPGDYTTFKPFFSQVIGDYHKGDPACALTHTNCWDTSNVGENGVLDLKKLGLKDPLSMRVRVGRNLKAFNLPGAMDQAERIAFEKRMLGAFDAIKAKFGGTVYSMTPKFGDAEENPNLISSKTYDELVAKHVMFKDMDADPYLKSAGISSDWPYGRGCWQSDDKQKIIWFGEEDQLRIMVMKTGYLLNEVFSELKTLLDTVESIDGIDFAKDDQYGYVTSCPTNLGTGMRASVHVKVTPRTDPLATPVPQRTPPRVNVPRRHVPKSHAATCHRCPTSPPTAPTRRRRRSPARSASLCAARAASTRRLVRTVPWTSRRARAFSSRSRRSSPRSTTASPSSSPPRPPPPSEAQARRQGRGCDAKSSRARDDVEVARSAGALVTQVARALRCQR